MQRLLSYFGLRANFAPVLIAFLFLGCAASRAAENEVVILGLWPFSGSYADLGQSLDTGAKVALDQAHYQAGRFKVRYVTRDSETKPSVSARRTQEAIDSENVKFVIGPWSSGDALAVTEVAKKNKVLYFFSGGTEDISGKRCNRYAFQWAASAFTAVEANLRNFKKAHPEAKSIYLIVTDYAFGWSLQKYVERLAPQFGLTVLGADRHPLGQREFSPYIIKAQAAAPDAILLVNFGLDAVAAVRQLHSFGFIPKKPVIMSWSSGLDELIQLDPGMRSNLQVGSSYYWTVDNDENRGFVEDFKKKSNGVLPGSPAAAAYGMIKTILKGVELADSSEPRKVIEALEAFKGQTLLGETSINRKTHQVERPYFILRTKSADQLKGDYDFADIVDASSTPQPAEINECKDIGGF
jgi:branched-chain amino acid transport system substrate-binding protein